MARVKMGLRPAFWAALAATVAACATTTESGPTVSQPTAAPTSGDRVAAKLERYYRFHHQGGLLLLIAMSLDSLPVAQAKRPEVDRIRTDLLYWLEPTRVAEQEVAAALADGVAAGSFDRARVERAVEAVGKAAGVAHNESLPLLDRLHALLSPIERDDLADSIESQWLVWQRANFDREPGNPERTRLAVLSDQLGLSQEQQQSIRAQSPVSGPDPQQMAERIRGFSAAFRESRFEARAPVSESTTAILASWGASNMSHFIEALTPILTPDQRTKLVELLREDAQQKPIGEASR